MEADHPENIITGISKTANSMFLILEIAVWDSRRYLIYLIAKLISSSMHLNVNKNKTLTKWSSFIFKF